LFCAYGEQRRGKKLFSKVKIIAVEDEEGLAGPCQFSGGCDSKHVRRELREPLGR
jgi:hypothetical protein